MTRRWNVFAVGLAVAGVATAAISSGWVWVRLVSSDYPGSLWPFPGLYLVEAVVLPALILWRVAAARHSSALAWLAIGALATMGVFGAMTIGVYLVLALVFVIPATLVADVGQSTASRKVAGVVMGGALQGALMIGVIQYLMRRPY